MKLTKVTALFLALFLSLIMVLGSAQAAIPVPLPSPTVLPLLFPAAPSDLTASYAGGKITLNWKDNSSNETGFEISAEFNGNGGYTKVPAGTTTYTFDGTYYSGQTYTYAVRAYNAVGNSAWTPSVNVTIPDVTFFPPVKIAPSAPSNIKATYSNGKITVTWADNSNNEMGFDVLTEVENGGGGSIQVAANTTSWVDDSAHVKGVTYSFAVRSFNFFGHSAWSSKVSVTIPDTFVIPPVKLTPSAPTNLVATYAEGVITLNWKDNSNNESGFEISTETGSGSGGSVKVGANSTAWVDTSPHALGEDYIFKVRAYNFLGNSGWSNTVTITVTSSSNPATPTPPPSTPTPQPATPTPPPSTPQPPALVLDGTQSNWAVNEIQQAYGYGLTFPGIENNFQKKITRQEFCVMAIKLYEKLSGKQAVIVESPFTDTDNPDVIKAYNLQIVYGTGGNRFTPDRNVQRQEMAVFIYRSLKAANKLPVTEISNNFPFDDAKDISSWALDHMKFSYQNGIIVGSNNRITPLGNTTREQAIAIIKRTYEKFR